MISRLTCDLENVTLTKLRHTSEVITMHTFEDLSKTELEKCKHYGKSRCRKLLVISLSSLIDFTFNLL